MPAALRADLKVGPSIWQFCNTLKIIEAIHEEVSSQLARTM